LIEIKMPGLHRDSVPSVIMGELTCQPSSC
jgi:hypothetical protein